MPRIKLTIADTDSGYLEALVNYIHASYPKGFQVNSFSSMELLRQFLSIQNNTVDVLLISPDLYQGEFLKDNVKTALLLADSHTSVSDIPLNTLCKYQHGENLIDAILKECSKHQDDYVLTSGGKKTRVIGVYSPHGGAGKSTIAVNLCKHYVSRGLSAFYLNLETNPSTASFFESPGDYDLSHMLFHVKERNRNLGLRLEAIRRVDKTGVHYFAPQTRLSELEDTASGELSVLAGKLRGLNQYDVVMMDMDSGFNHKNIEIMKLCDRILIVLVPGKISVHRYGALVRELEILSGRDGIDIADKMLPILNKVGDEEEDFDDWIPEAQEISIRLPMVDSFKVNDISKGAEYRHGLEGIVEILEAAGR